MLFNISIKLLGEIIWRFGLKCHLYTDDTHLFLMLTVDPSAWMQANKLKLNPDKMEVLLVSRRSDPICKVLAVRDVGALSLK